MNAESATVDAAEVAKFSRIAADWWDEDGTSAPLHRLNPARMRYIRAQVMGHFAKNPPPDGGGRDPSKGWEGEGRLMNLTLTRPAMPADLPHRGEVNLKPFTTLAIADIGCGGGIVCEPLARLGAKVTGIDASAEAIAVAVAHAAEAGLAIDYRATTSDALAATGARFDVVLALEVIEHVADVGAFVASLKALLKPGGLLILSTPNRTARSFAAVIVGAEYIMRWLPRGTHDWRRFARPSELARVLRANGLTVRDVTGLIYDPIKREFSLDSNKLEINYFISCFS